jgi:hypothetical protein
VQSGTAVKVAAKYGGSGRQGTGTLLSGVPSGSVATDDLRTAEAEERSSMALSRLAQEFASEIANHDWEDAPYRWDRAGHRRATDTKQSDKSLSPQETQNLKCNVVSVVSQVLWHRDRNFDPYEFAEACGLDTRPRGRLDGSFLAAIRQFNDQIVPPGQPLPSARPLP